MRYLRASWILLSAASATSPHMVMHTDKQIACGVWSATPSRIPGQHDAQGGQLCTHSEQIKHRWPGYDKLFPNEEEQATAYSVRSASAFSRA